MISTARDTTDRRMFRVAAAVYGIGTLVHTIDHFRRGTDSVTEHVFWLGSVATIVAFFVIGLGLGGHRLAPHAAVWFALPHAIGISAVHYLPRWSVFSDAFPGAASVSLLSWVAVALEVGGALAFAAVGASMLRQERAQAMTLSPG